MQTTARQAVATGKLLPLESLRGIAALSVAVFHMDIGSHLNNVFTDHAWLMVDFFFVLSGFVIALNYQERITSFADLGRFQKKRFWRLYPLHLLMLLVFVCIELAKFVAERKFGLEANTAAFSVNDFPSFVANLLLLQNWVSTTVTFNYPSWSISSEFYTYALFGLIVLVTRRSGWLVVTVSVLLVAVSGVALQSIVAGVQVIPGPLRCLYSFFIGVLIYPLFRRAGADSIANSIPAMLAIVACVVTIVLLGDRRAAVLLAPPVFALAVYCVARTSTNTVVSKTLSQRWLVYLGAISYGVYMIHAAVWWMVNQITKLVFKLPTHVDAEGKVTVEMPNTFLADVVMLAGLALVVLLAHWSYVYLERRFYQSRS